MVFTSGERRSHPALALQAAFQEVLDRLRSGIGGVVALLALDGETLADIVPLDFFDGQHETVRVAPFGRPAAAAVAVAHSAARRMEGTDDESSIDLAQGGKRGADYRINMRLVIAVALKDRADVVEQNGADLVLLDVEVNLLVERCRDDLAVPVGHK